MKCTHMYLRGTGAPVIAPVFGRGITRYLKGRYPVFAGTLPCVRKAVTPYSQGCYPENRYPSNRVRSDSGALER